jgi:hypothetical protein
MNCDRKQNHRRTARTLRFEWSAWLAAAFVLLVVAPALHAHEQQALAPLYAAMMPAPHSSAENRETARTPETALAVLQIAKLQTSRNVGDVHTPQVQHADGSLAHSSSQSTVESDRTALSPPLSVFAPRFITTHVVLASALSAHEAGYRSGQRNNRSHE